MDEVRRRRFPWFFLLFLLLMIGGGVYGVLRIEKYLLHRMEVLEQSNPDPVAEEIAQALATGDFQSLPVTIANGEQITGEVTFRELSRVSDFVREAFQDRQVNVVPLSESNGERMYRVDAGAQPVLLLTLAEKKKALEFGYSAWEGKSVQLTDGALLPETLSFTVPADDVITLDGTVLERDESGTEVSAVLPLLSQLVSLELAEQPSVVRYKAEGLFRNPEVTITDATGRPVAFTEEEGHYKAGFSAPEGFAEEQEGWILSMIEPWGRYLTEDGALGPAVAKVRAGTPAYHTISKATVHWTAGHAGTSFADKSVDNFRCYSALCFSCDVHYKQTVHFREGRVWDTHMTWVFVRKDENAPWLLADVRMLQPPAAEEAENGETP
ncbi:MAG: hypothetical protein IK016_07315 [Lachnospiraceae bacterium]|nr:hypothetical protein [Lachnospiraceae bacterium]